MRFALLATGPGPADAARAAVAGGHELAAVITAASRAAVDDYRRLAEDLGSALLTVSALDGDRVDDVCPPGEIPVAVSAAWPSLVPGSFLARFPTGVYNAHPGPLPSHPGPFPVPWQLLDGDTVTLTMHRMDGEFDGGPVWASRSVEALGWSLDRAASWVERQLTPMVVGLLDAVEAGDVTLRPQQGPRLRWCRRPDEVDRRIDWSAPADAVAKLVRAMSGPSLGARTWADDTEVLVWAARAEALPAEIAPDPGRVREVLPTGEVAVDAGEGVVVLESVEALGTGRCSPQQLLGRPGILLGIDPVAETADLRRRVERLETNLLRLQRTVSGPHD